MVQNVWVLWRSHLRYRLVPVAGLRFLPTVRLSWRSGVSFYLLSPFSELASILFGLALFGLIDDTP